MKFKQNSYYQHNFKDLSLVDDTVENKEFEECVFTKCSWVDNQLTSCKLIDCRFIGCTLSAVKPTDSRFIKTSFKNSKVIGIDWTLAGEIRDLVFENCQTSYSNFKLLSLPGLVMTDCTAEEVDFGEADLPRADFRATNFAGSRFFKNDLTAADFRQAKNYTIDAATSRLKGAKFSLPQALALLDNLDIVLE